MKKIKSIFIFLMLFSVKGLSQPQSLNNQVRSRKGDLYFYWGWNWSWYSNSDIEYKGSGYDFKLYNVIANDRQTPFDWNTYFNPMRITIPQYNFRLGYFLNNHYDISIGVDHMKYVVQQEQMVKISGNISNTETQYDGSYSNDDILITEGFLKFEHTDGLNYVNFELRRYDQVIDWNKVKIGLTEGAGTGFLLPRTNTTLLNKQRYDEFHLAGYGISAVFGVNILIYKYFFIQSEVKGGFIHMPDIRTTMSESDKASQHFFFGQANILFGANFNLSRKNK
ncbi:MAG: hypothetical protein U0W24_02740 [Bacteroidales bacterium]